MIRLFSDLCKAALKKLSEKTIFKNATTSFKHQHEKCPNCGANYQLFPYGDYSRGLVSRIDDKTDLTFVRPLRFKCNSCGKTHALLPDNTIPYSQYSLRFMLTVLVAYFERTTKVAVICEKYGIAVSTLYAWKVRLTEHKELLLGVLENKKETALAFLKGLLESASLSASLCSFFRKHGFSFMQNPANTIEWHAAATQTAPT